MATPLRFRYSPDSWSDGRVQSQILQVLNANLGARSVSPRVDIGGNWQTDRFEMDNGDVALFARDDERAYWMGNTETPEALWRTNKVGWDEVPYHVSRWAQRELLDTLHEEEPWLEAYPYLTWFFLPVFMSKDGRNSTRTFFREHAAGFPEATRREATTYLESFLRAGTLDPYREVMAGKLGTSTHVNQSRMSAAIAEFLAADILVEAGYRVTPEIEVTTGHSLDFRASAEDTNVLVEVTRPQPPHSRAASSPVAAVRDTAETKTSGQLSEHGGGAVFFVDCSSFSREAWKAVRAGAPDVRHRPAVVYRVDPSAETVEGYQKGRVPLDLEPPVTMVTD